MACPGFGITIDETLLVEANCIDGMIWLIKDRATVQEAVAELQKARDHRLMRRADVLVAICDDREKRSTT